MDLKMNLAYIRDGLVLCRLCDGERSCLVPRPRPNPVFQGLGCVQH